MIALLALPPKKYKGAMVGGVVGLILLVVAAVFGDHGLIHLLRMRGERSELEHQAFELQQRNEHLRQRIQRLQSDDRYLERLARERLGLARQGEIIYRVRPPTPAPFPSR
ncbi:MAG: septum formation initiator family protein [Candidatus Binatia bacterium]